MAKSSLGKLILSVFNPWPHIWPKVVSGAEYYQILQNLAKSMFRGGLRWGLESFQNLGKSCQILPNPTKSCQIYLNPAKSCPNLRNPEKSSLPNPAKSCKILANPAKYDQILRNPAKSCQIRASLWGLRSVGFAVGLWASLRTLTGPRGVEF